MYAKKCSTRKTAEPTNYPERKGIVLSVCLDFCASGREWVAELIDDSSYVKPDIPRFCRKSTEWLCIPAS
jgi:hypothetical protein